MCPRGYTHARVRVRVKGFISVLCYMSHEYMCVTIFTAILHITVAVHCINFSLSFVYVNFQDKEIGSLYSI